MFLQNVKLYVLYKIKNCGWFHIQQYCECDLVGVCSDTQTIYDKLLQLQKQNKVAFSKFPFEPIMKWVFLLTCYQLNISWAHNML